MSQEIDDLIDDLVLATIQAPISDTLCDCVNIMELKLRHAYDEILQLRKIIDKKIKS